MAKKAEPKENKYGIDRWTSNGYGIEILNSPNKTKKTTKKTTTKKRGK